MIFIAHRGNIDGPNEKENRPDYIDAALEKNLDVEIDLRYNNGFFLGHDEPQYNIDIDWLEHRKNKLWIHCKDSYALEKLLCTDFNYFWHDTDDYTITSKGFIWAYPGKRCLNDKTIIVMPEKSGNLDEIKYTSAYGVCSDKIMQIW